MYFRRVVSLFLAACLVLLMACSDESREQDLVDLHAIAQQDIISISFAAGSETVFSVNNVIELSVTGLKSNGVDTVPVTDNLVWSLSEGAVSTIDQTGQLTTGAVAESFTVTVAIGPLTDTLDVTVSTAKFDRVVELHQEAFTLDMCRTQVLTPIGLYIGQNGAADERRPVDSSIINTITWSIVNQGDTAVSKRAHIETANNQAELHTLSAGDVVIQATARSVETGLDVTSADFAQTIDVGISSIKLCNVGDTDLAACAVTAVNLEEANVESLISVGTYQTTNGVDEFIDVTKNSQWGVSNTNISAQYANDRQQVDVTGLVPSVTPVLTVACGEIGQSLATEDIAQGVILNESVSCANNRDCQLSSATFNVTPLTATSLSVTANGVDLVSQEALNLATRPTEIALEVTATFSDGSPRVVTTSLLMSYTTTSGSTGVITNGSTAGTYTVLAAGTAEIGMLFSNGGLQFNAIIVIP